jgi:hypothetical protein
MTSPTSAPQRGSESRSTPIHDRIARLHGAHCYIGDATEPNGAGRLVCGWPELHPSDAPELPLPSGAPADYEQMRTNPTWPLVMVEGQDYETLRRYYGFGDRRKRKR